MRLGQIAPKTACRSLVLVIFQPDFIFFNEALNDPGDPLAAFLAIDFRRKNVIILLEVISWLVFLWSSYSKESPLAAE